MHNNNGGLTCLMMQRSDHMIQHKPCMRQTKSVNEVLSPGLPWVVVNIPKEGNCGKYCQLPHFQQNSKIDEAVCFRLLRQFPTGCSNCQKIMDFCLIKVSGSIAMPYLWDHIYEEGPSSWLPLEFDPFLLAPWISAMYNDVYVLFLRKVWWFQTMFYSLKLWEGVPLLGGHI